MSSKLWSLENKFNRDIDGYLAGEDRKFDTRLLKYDCEASSVHADMLQLLDILTEEEAGAIKKELNNINSLHEKGKFQISPEDEDCHSAIEKHLTDKLGDTGRKIHALRSRNDQVLTALRLYMKDQLEALKVLLRDLIDEITGFSEAYGKTEIPGYTHTRKAMPSSVAIWSEAWRDSMIDNLFLVNAVFHIINQSPLGTGAGYGVPYENHREYTAEKLGFGKVQDNPVYTQNSRHKFEGMALTAMSNIMLDLNRLASDLIFFTASETAFFILPEFFCTGSSIMPQKTNPDVLELMRGNYQQVVGSEDVVRSTGVNLISGYHRDMQITKGHLMKSFDITSASLRMGVELFSNLGVSEEGAATSMTRELYAAEDALKLVKEGVPFRDAYHLIKKEYFATQCRKHGKYK